MHFYMLFYEKYLLLAIYETEHCRKEGKSSGRKCF